MKYVLKKQRTKKIRRNGVDCSKKAGIIRMTRKELGAFHRAPKMHPVFATCFSTSRIFRSARVRGMTKKNRRCAGLAERIGVEIFDESVQTCFYDVTSD